VSNRANEIALGYHQKAMAELRATEARLQAEIAALQREISTLRMMRSN
jgi:prefoldin subunit 5